MKITCQACQSKYNVADEKVSGKMVKIRCRKCGATIVVDGTNVAASGAHAPAAAETGARAAAVEAAPPWHVNVADNDQRTMTMAELVDAYNASTITQDTYIWTEGMDDWKPLRDVDAVVAALHENAPPASIAASSVFGVEAPVNSTRPRAGANAREEATHSPQAAAMETRAVAYASPLDAPAEAAPKAEPKRAALKRETRGRDLFGAGTAGVQSSRSGSDAPGVLTSAPLMGQPGLSLGDEASNKLTGERNENSVLFSLAMLTKNADERAPAKAGGAAAATSEDSGLIDLKALAAKAESVRPPAMSDAALFSAPLGSGQPMGAPFAAVSSLGDAPQKSRLPAVILVGAVIVALVAVAGFVGAKFGAANAAASATPAGGPAPSSSAGEPSASASASAAPEASAAASASAAPSASAAKPKPPTGGGTYHPSAAAATAKPANPTGAATAASPTAAPKKNDCGCNGDLMCLMKCSTAH